MSIYSDDVAFDMYCDSQRDEYALDRDDAALAAYEDELARLQRQDDANRAADRDSLDSWLDNYSRFLNQHEEERV